MSLTILRDEVKHDQRNNNGLLPNADQQFLIAVLKSQSKQELVKKCDMVGKWSDLDAKKFKATSIAYRVMCITYSSCFHEISTEGLGCSLKRQQPAGNHCLKDVLPQAIPPPQGPTPKLGHSTRHRQGRGCRLLLQCNCEALRLEDLLLSWPNFPPGCLAPVIS